MASYTKGERKAVYAAGTGKFEVRVYDASGKLLTVGVFENVADAKLDAAAPRMIEFIQELADGGNGSKELRVHCSP